MSGKEIDFRNVNYRYENSTLDALNDFSFTFSPGRHYAIAGENGAGKSTVLNLLMQFLQPNAGVIELDGQNIRRWEAQGWRKGISWIGQKPMVFNSSLLENVRLFDPAYTEDQVKRALELARLGDYFKTLPEGLATPLLELGERFSAGERQRLAIARAFLKNGSLVLMDEPTSHLDAHLNNDFLESLNELIQNRTSIVVAHHTALMKSAEEILFVKNGKLMEAGSFEELTDKAGYFAEFYTGWYRMKVILRLLGFLKPYLGEVLVSILLGVATIAAGIGLLGTSAYLISSAALHPSIAELQVAIVGVRFFGISRAVFRYGERLVSHSVNLRLVSSLRSWYFEQMDKNDQKKLAVYRSGDLLDRALHNLESLEGFYVRVLSPFIVFSSSYPWCESFRRSLPSHPRLDSGRRIIDNGDYPSNFLNDFLHQTFKEGCPAIFHVICSFD